MLKPKPYFSAARALLPLPVFLLMVVYFAVAFIASQGNYNPWAFVLGVLAIASWCVNATALEKLGEYDTDQKIGRGDSEAALVMGVLRAPHLQVVVVASAILALTLVASYGLLALGVMLVALGLNYAYAEPALAVFQRDEAHTALLLPVGYVAMPMLLGSLAAGRLPSPWLAALIIVCYVQFALRLRSGRHRPKDDATT